MTDFRAKEQSCEISFSELEECYHIWTPENFEIIFTCEDDFKAAMNIIGICASCFADITVLTFEVMSNHLHLTAAGKQPRLSSMFSSIKLMLKKYFKVRGRNINWDGFEAKTRLLNSLEDVRNVIVYNNRNGFIVSPEHSPFTYPWGANRFFFNPDACTLANTNSKRLSVKQIRYYSHSRMLDNLKGISTYNGYALPLSFCAIKKGESLFRDATHYFNKLSRNIETNATIANEIGENIYYTDDDLYDVILKICRQKFSETNPSLLNYQSKLELAKIIRFNYNASQKQLQRMLKLGPEVVSALFANTH